MISIVNYGERRGCVLGFDQRSTTGVGKKQQQATTTIGFESVGGEGSGKNTTTKTTINQSKRKRLLEKER